MKADSLYVTVQNTWLLVQDLNNYATQEYDIALQVLVHVSFPPERY